MPGKIDLTGKRFGRLLVLEEDPVRRYHTIFWKCQCDCGSIKSINGRDLKSGKIVSCGCYMRECNAQNYKDLTGQTFGYLTVIRKTGKRHSGSIIWECQCRCGNIVEINSVYLLNGDTTSCGCYQKERIHERCASKLIGQRFGKLVVEEETDKRYYKTIIWKCKCDCGNYIEVPTTSLTRHLTASCGCVKSHGERKIVKILSQNNIPFETQKSFSTCVFDTGRRGFFDFYVNNSYLIEYDGEQHFRSSDQGWNTEEAFQKTKERDKYKNQWCRENNIPLIRIPYTQYDDLSIEDLQLETTKFLLT